jgi:hypothetical protein
VIQKLRRLEINFLMKNGFLNLRIWDPKHFGIAGSGSLYNGYGSATLVTDDFTFNCAIF